MTKQELEKEVRKKIKKKTSKWKIDIDEVYSFDCAYDLAQSVMSYLENLYPEKEEREKVKFHKLRASILKKEKGIFSVLVEYH